MSEKLLNYACSLKILAGLVGILGASSLIPLPAFSQSVFLGAYTTPYETIIIPDVQQISIPGGTITSLGFVANPNGTFTNSSGTTITPDGIVVTPNGWISTPKGALISPNGWVSDLNNRTITSPDGKVTRLGNR